jgi:hypothetical protein
MTGLVRKATLLTVCGVLAASAVMAGVPDPTKSSGVTPNINLGAYTASGDGNGVVNAEAIKLITVRDAGNNPIANSTVVINFTSCVSQDIRLSNDQVHHPGALFNCAAKTVTAVTNASGVATFRVSGGATNGGGNPPGHTAGCAEVRADGVLLGTIRVGAPDENFAGGIAGTDLGFWASDRFGAYRARLDFNGSGAVDGIDLGIWADFRFGPGAGFTHSLCP